jgi:putative ATPase
MRLIHRFSKSQQDSLLAAVEGMDHVNRTQPKIPALKLFLPYYPLSSLCIKRLYKRRSGPFNALKHFSLKDKRNRSATATFWWWWTQVIEYIWTGHKRLCWQRNYHYKWKSFELVHVLYDKSGEQHYDIVSAFIKSIRGSDQTELFIG